MLFPLRPDKPLEGILFAYQSSAIKVSHCNTGDKAILSARLAATLPEYADLNILMRSLIQFSRRLLSLVAIANKAAISHLPGGMHSLS